MKVLHSLGCIVTHENRNDDDKTIDKNWTPITKILHVKFVTVGRSWKLSENYFNENVVYHSILRSCTSENINNELMSWCFIQCKIFCGKLMNWFPFFRIEIIPGGMVQPTFTLSKHGNLILTYKGYAYVRASCSKTSTRWRCSYSVGSGYACLAKAFTDKPDSIEGVKFTGEHRHKPKYHWRWQ